MKKNKTLHYAKKGSEDIKEFKFKKIDDILNFIDNNCCDINGYEQLGCVYLLSMDSILDNNKIFRKGAIIIDHRLLEIVMYLNALKTRIEVDIEIYQETAEEFYNTFYLQEYGSYEEAYKVALSMQEEEELCYEK